MTSRNRTSPGSLGAIGFRVPFLLSALGAIMLLWAVTGAGADRFDLDEAYGACLDMPDYALGGAMAGDCMNDQSAELDLQIETLLARAAKKYCRAEDRDAIAAAQAAWRGYRDGYCTLIENSPGNTGAWIRAGACRLDLTQKRLESLFFLTDHAYSWCLPMQLLQSLSHFGDPAGLARRDEETGIAWSIRDAGGARFLDISSGPAEADAAEAGASIDISSCRYCSGGADCNDGVFVFSREADDGAVSHAAAHLCTMEDKGPRLDIVALPAGGAPERTAFRASRHIAWIIEDGGLSITLDGESEARWPEGP